MRAFIIGIAVLAMASFANAETFTVSFEFTGDADSFTLFERVGDEAVALVQDIHADARSFSFQAEKPTAGCRTIFLAAIHLGAKSPYSNTAGICADPTLPDFYVPPSQPTGLAVTE